MARIEALLLATVWIGLPVFTTPIEAVAEDRKAGGLAVIGQIVPRQSGVVAAAIAAPVHSVMVVAGDRVEEGEALARLDIADRRADLEIARAQIGVAEAQIAARQASLEVERANLRRQESLRSSAAFNASRLEDSQTEVARLSAEIAVARAQFEEAKARASRLLVDIDRSKVLAPYDAVVTAREIDAGDFVTPGRQLFTLVNLGTLEVEADVPIAAVRALREGIRVEAETRDGVPVAARVRALIPVENPLTRTRTVRFSIEGAPALAVGQSIELHLPDAAGG